MLIAVRVSIYISYAMQDSQVNSNDIPKLDVKVNSINDANGHVVLKKDYTQDYSEWI